jgi:hypothetical protein
MDILRGIARRIRTASEVKGTWSKDGGSVTTTYLAIFELDNLTIHVSASRPITVNEGDEVAVAGGMDDGIFIAHACRNFSRGTLDYEAWVIGVVLGSIFIVVGLGIIIAMLQEFPSERWWAFLGVIFAAAGAYFAWSWNRVRLAQATLREINR